METICGFKNVNDAVDTFAKLIRERHLAEAHELFVKIQREVDKEKNEEFLDLFNLETEFILDRLEEEDEKAMFEYSQLIMNRIKNTVSKNNLVVVFK